MKFLLFLLLLVVTGICPLIGWRKASALLGQALRLALGLGHANGHRYAPKAA